jgi:hypothetical protein
VTAKPGVRRVRLGDQRFVLDDEQPDGRHDGTGRRTETIGPPPGAAAT